MRWGFGILSFITLALVIWLAVTSVIHIGWIFGWGIVCVIAFLLILDVITDAVGWGTVIAIIIALFLLELFVW